jgi:hypothetical protein
MQDTNVEALYELGNGAKEALERYATALREADMMPLTRNRRFVALNDDLQLELQRSALNHQHLLERSQQNGSGLVVPN